MADRYPNHPGAKGKGVTRETSEAAADAIAPSVCYLQGVVLRRLEELRAATVLETVATTVFPRESLQPRFSELRRMGMVEPTGQRRRNPSGKPAAVLRPTEKGRAWLKGRTDAH